MNYNYSSMENDSPDYEYSNYDSNTDQNSVLQRRYQKILANRFPNSRSEDASSYQSPIQEIIPKRSKNKKYNFHIPAHLKSKSKEFLSQNRDGSKYNLEVLSQGKYSIKQNQSYSNITKRRMTTNLHEKFSPGSRRLENIKHHKRNKNKENPNFEERSGSLPNITRSSTKAISHSHNNSQSRLSKMYKMVNTHLGENSKRRHRRDHNSGDDTSYGKSTRNTYTKQQHLNSRQILERIHRKKHHNSFGPV